MFQNIFRINKAKGAAYIVDILCLLPEVWISYQQSQFWYVFHTMEVTQVLIYVVGYLVQTNIYFDIDLDIAKDCGSQDIQTIVQEKKKLNIENQGTDNWDDDGDNDDCIDDDDVAVLSGTDLLHVSSFSKELEIILKFKNISISRKG